MTHQSSTSPYVLYASTPQYLLHRTLFFPLFFLPSIKMAFFLCWPGQNTRIHCQRVSYSFPQCPDLCAHARVSQVNTHSPMLPTKNMHRIRVAVEWIHNYIWRYSCVRHCATLAPKLSSFSTDTVKNDCGGGGQKLLWRVICDQAQNKNNN